MVIVFTNIAHVKPLAVNTVSINIKDLYADSDP